MSDYVIHDIDAQRGANHSSVFGDLIDGLSDAYLVRNVLNQIDTQQLRERINAQQRRFVKNATFSVCNDESYALGCGDSLDDYLAKSRKNAANLTELFGYDIEIKISDILQQFSGGLPVTLPQRQQLKYKGVTLRICQQGESFKAHVGNQFRETVGEFSHMETITEHHDQVSFFLVIANAESGGELILYNLTWDDTPPVFKSDPRFSGGNKLSLRHTVVEKFYKEVASLRPEPGDMLIFAGGRIWHKVETIRGAENRITLGGFIARSKESDCYYYWS